MKPEVIKAWTAIAGALAIAAATPASAALKPGDAAPGFDVEAAQGGRVFHFDLASALKRGPVVVYFYPKSFTSTCTLEAHAFAEAMPTLAAAGASVIGLSADGIAIQRDFSAKECRDTFPVGADPSLAVAKSYDAALAIPGTNLGFAARTSYVIAPDGHILSALSDRDAEPHIANALAALRAWKAGGSR